MDYQKEHNGWLTFIEHWGRFLILLIIVVLAALLLPIISHSHKITKIIQSDDSSGVLSSDAGSVYWNVLSEPATNQTEFVLLLPSTTTSESGSKNYTSYAYDFCNLQIKSNQHQWKIEGILDWQTGMQTVQIHDLTANSTTSLALTNGRYWQLDDEGHAAQVENIDPAIMAKIFDQVKAYQTNSAGTEANAD